MDLPLLGTFKRDTHFIGALPNQKKNNGKETQGKIYGSRLSHNKQKDNGSSQYVREEMIAHIIQEIYKSNLILHPVLTCLSSPPCLFYCSQVTESALLFLLPCELCGPAPFPCHQTYSFNGTCVFLIGLLGREMLETCSQTLSF